MRVFGGSEAGGAAVTTLEGARAIKTGTGFVTPLVPALFMSHCKAGVRECCRRATGELGLACKCQADLIGHDI